MRTDKNNSAHSIRHGLIIIHNAKARRKKNKWTTKIVRIQDKNYTEPLSDHYHWQLLRVVGEKDRKIHEILLFTKFSSVRSQRSIVIFVITTKASNIILCVFQNYATARFANNTAIYFLFVECQRTHTDIIMFNYVLYIIYLWWKIFVHLDFLYTKIHCVLI